MKELAIIFFMNDDTLKTVYCKDFDEVSAVMWRMNGKYKKSILKTV